MKWFLSWLVVMVIYVVVTFLGYYLFPHESVTIHTIDTGYGIVELGRELRGAFCYAWGLAAGLWIAFCESADS